MYPRGIPESLGYGRLLVYPVIGHHYSCIYVICGQQQETLHATSLQFYLPVVDFYADLFWGGAAFGVRQDDLPFHQGAAAGEGVVAAVAAARVPAILGEILGE